jgi:predicted SprT family Zn-dependent metalloprotease
MKPTAVAYAELQTAYDHFNQALFHGSLPDCLITLQREKNSCGYFSAERFVDDNKRYVHEIALNPSYFAVSPIEEVMQTLVHEQCHLWQYIYGKPGRRRYHNREFAEKMESIGLMPSSTGRPGGRKTGEHMSDYIIEGGLFELECRRLLTEDYRITWVDRYPPRHALSSLSATVKNDSVKALSVMTALESRGMDKVVASNEEGEISVILPQEQPKPTRVKFTCSGCSSSAWGKPSLNLICGDCNIHLEPQA